MYFISTQDIKIEPRITEDYVIEGESEDKLIGEMVSYLQAKYNNLPNPITLERKVREVVKDEQGKTRTERFMEEQRELDDKYMEQYRTERDTQMAAYNEAVDKIRNEYNQKMDVHLTEYENGLKQLSESQASSEEREKFEEEWTLKKEQLQWEQQQAEQQAWDTHRKS